MRQDPFGDTRPTPGLSLADTQPVRPLTRRELRRRGGGFRRGCLSILLAGVILLAIYFLLPFSTNILLLGTDSRDPGLPLGRTDTIILSRISPLEPEVSLLSVPRDLWVPIPGYGENRINAAYFFGEADTPGQGPQTIISTIGENFGVQMDYYVLIQFDGLVGMIDALGGVTVDLPRAMSGYEEGLQHLDGTQALAFVRDRAGSDDFFRIERGQIFLRGLLGEVRDPLTWLNMPQFTFALSTSLETNVPVWLWPRLVLALLRAGPEGVDGHLVTREMTTGFSTEEGAAVLLPDWDQILAEVEAAFP